ncbi:MAG: hypothetical protein P3A28_03830 [Gemmatimonadota bacterium]|nr:hypothetical protein [Gemmatimonadota bacterium]
MVSVLGVDATAPSLESLDPAGGTPVSVAPASPLESGRLETRAVAPAVTPGFTAFLDGIQRSVVIGQLGGLVPVVHGTVGAVVRVRRERVLSTWRDGALVARALYLPLTRLDAATRAACEAGGIALVDTGEEGDPAHPHGRLASARLAIQRAREEAESKLAMAWCAAGGGPLYVDGSISGFGEAALSPLAVGVVKSHRTLYVPAPDVPLLAGLAVGSRTTAFAVDARRRARIASWYLRLRSGDGADPFSGLVRVEIAESAFSPARADDVSDWVLAERQPVALPDPRWRAMAYGIRDCEEYLRAVAD